MKIVTWNCNGALRKKFKKLLIFDADLYIVQECEDPSQAQAKEYVEWAKNYLWVGSNKNKGVGIFAAEHIKLEALNWSITYLDHTVKYFLPCLVNDDFQVVGVWAHQNNSPTFGYVGQVWKYLQVNRQNIRKAVIAGDFNSNAIWDQWDRWWNHSDVVKILSELDVHSLYHRHFEEEQGKESKPTFFWGRKLSRPYHIDFVFGSGEFLNALNNFEIGDPAHWLTFSDHLPVVCQFSHESTY